MREELYIGIWHILVFVYLLNLLMADGKEESINIVQFLKTNSGKKGEGMPVVRNPQFYFLGSFIVFAKNIININTYQYFNF